MASVALDDVAGARVATQHLIDLGHTRIAHLKLGGTQRSGSRVRGWREALGRAGVKARPDWVVPGGYTVDSGYRGMRDLLDLAERPTAVVVGNALAAIGALTALRDAGAALPADMSVVAFHDLLYAAHLVPPLTTVAMPLRELGAASVALLVERLEGGAVRHVVVREPVPVLIERGSTAPAG